MSVEIPVYLFEKCDFILEVVAVCVSKALEWEIFPNSIACADIIVIYKKIIHLIRTIIDFRA